MKTTAQRHIKKPLFRRLDIHAPKQNTVALRRFWNNKFQAAVFFSKNENTGGVLKSPFFKDTAVSRRYRCVLFHFLSPQPIKKSLSIQRDQSGSRYAVWQSISECLISCVYATLCRAGAFCLSDFWTLCPEVRGGSPGCRSPPAFHFVSAQPINRNKMEDKLWQRSIWKIFIIGT